MNEFDLYKMIFFTLDHYWDEHKGEKLGLFLSGMNPFLFLGEGSAVPDIYPAYQNYLSGRAITLENSYDIACGYIKHLGEDDIAEAFAWVDKDRWIKKCKEYMERERCD